MQEATDRAASAAGIDPPYLYPRYRSTVLRAPGHPPLILPAGLADRTGPVFDAGSIDPLDQDLTRQNHGEPLGERIIVHGRVIDSTGRPVPAALIEIWQANASGRYAHAVDNHRPRLSNFTGGPVPHRADGPPSQSRAGAHPRANHDNAMPGAHPLSVFSRAFLQRLVPRCFLGDPPSI